MRAFSFSLENLLKVRIRAEEEIERRLAAKNREMEAVKKNILDLQDELKSFQFSEKKRRQAGEDINSMRQSVAYRNRLKLEMLKQGQHLDDLSVQAYEIRKELVKATQEKKAVEILKEKRYREWNRQYNKSEQKKLDDVSMLGYIRKRSSG